MPVTRSNNLGPDALEQLAQAAALALTGGGMILAQRAQERAPVLTGRMMRSVHVTEPRFEEDGVSVSVGPTVEYAKYTEEMPWIIGKRPGPISQIKGATIPWLVPSLRDTEQEIRSFIANGLGQAVKALSQA